jgi:UDP-glucose-4-epimerase GalE
MSVVFVAGGAGYVGSHAVKALAAAGYDVVVYDDLSAGHREAVERIAAASPGRSVTLVEGDVLDGATLARAMAAARPAAVMHFAARLDVAESVREPLTYYHVNVTGTLGVLAAMAATGVSRFVFSSTCAMFGETDAPLHEDLAAHPVNTYGETKLAIERALPHVERATGIRWTALRYFNAAGADADGMIGEAHDPEIHLIPRAIAAAARGADFTVFGDDYPTPDGTCIRDYVHVSDLADAHVGALRRLEAGGESRAYNLGTGTGVSVRQVLDAVERAAGRPVPFRVSGRRPGDPARLVARSDRALNELGWRATRSLDDVVTTAWRWHERHPLGYASLHARSRTGPE